MKLIKVLSNDQQQALTKLSRLKVGALFMEPGTGKTRTAIELIKRTPAKFCLWLTPFQNKNNLIQEIKKWQLNIKFKVVGIETLSSSDVTYVDLIDLLNKYKKDDLAIVVDESLKIKNPNAIRTNRIINLGKSATYKLVLNGTPISKNILDLWAQFEFLSPKILNMTYNEFLDNFVEYVKIKNNVGKEKIFIKSFSNIDALYKIISPFIFEAKLNLKISQNNKIINFTIVKNSEDYFQLKSQMLRTLANTFDQIHFLSIAQKMQISYSCEPNKFKIIKGLVDDKTIIFCKFIKTKYALINYFPETKVLTYGKGSLGLNLQSYNKIIFFEQTWDYAQLDQAKHRIFRIGQKKEVNYFQLIGDVGLEKMIERNLNKKINILNYFKMLSKSLNTSDLLKKLKEEL